MTASEWNKTDFSPGSVLFPKALPFFCECNYVRIGQNIHNEVSVERSIFADVFAYQLISWDWKLNGSIDYFPIPHNTLCLPLQILHNLLS